MRPIKLQLQYFGPYEETLIDFQHFNESKLFLITGDTVPVRRRCLMA